MKTQKACITFCLCLALSVSVSGEERLKRSSGKSCREFVATFYKWYLAIALRNNRLPDSAFALKDKPHAFSSELLRQLREESEVQKRAGPDLVGLEHDPFFGGDGAGEGFTVDKITIKDDRCWAEIHNIWDGKKYERPDVTPELALKEGRWIFVDFYYPNPSDPQKTFSLLSELNEMRKDWKKLGLVKDEKPE
jgi:hypothetical protein